MIWLNTAFCSSNISIAPTMVSISPWVGTRGEQDSYGRGFSGSSLAELMVWATKFCPTGLAPGGGCYCGPWASCCCVWRIWHSTPVWASMNASTIVLGGGGGRSLPLLDAPKPLGELHVGPTIWKNWASIKYTFIRLFSQAKHVRWKHNWNKSSTRGKHNILELRILCAQLKTMRNHDSNVHYHAKVSSHWISNLESKANVITFGRIWYGGLILVVVNKISQLKHQSP
jgi:hypothetical protein